MIFDWTVWYNNRNLRGYASWKYKLEVQESSDQRAMSQITSPYMQGKTCSDNLSKYLFLFGYDLDQGMPYQYGKIGFKAIT